MATTAPAPTPDPAPATPTSVPGSPFAIVRGWLTSEHLLMVLAIITAALLNAGVIPSTSEAGKVAAEIISVLGALGYTAARTSLKATALRLSAGVPTTDSAAVKALRSLVGPAAAMLLALAIGAGLSHGCATTKADLKIAGGAFAACAESDVAQITATVLADIDGVITANAPSLEDDLGKIALSLTGDAFDCAVKAVLAIRAAVPNPSGSGAATAAESPGVVRARAYLAKRATAKATAKP